MRTLILLLAIGSMLLSHAEGTLVATGFGSSRETALRQALVEAIEMHSGVTLSSSERVELSSASIGMSADGQSHDVAVIGDEARNRVESSANGKISGYEVVSETYDAETKQYRLEVAVRFPERYVVELDPENRRRLAVVDFRPSGNTYWWCGGEYSTVDWVKVLTNKLNIRFTKTRRFTMLERKFVEEINDELANLKDENIAPQDVVRRCQKLATDYLVVGEVTFYPVQAPVVNPYTGRAMPMASQLFAEVSYRVVLAPTGQLKFADTIKVDAASIPANQIGEFISGSTDSVASLVIDGVMANYKLRDEATDGTEAAETAVETMNVTPVAPPPASAPSTIKVNANGGVVTPF